MPLCTPLPLPYLLLLPRVRMVYMRMRMPNSMRQMVLVAVAVAVCSIPVLLLLLLSLLLGCMLVVVLGVFAAPVHAHCASHSKSTTGTRHRSVRRQQVKSRCKEVWQTRPSGQGCGQVRGERISTAGRIG